MGKEKTVSAKGTVGTATRLPVFVACFRLQFFQLAFCFAQGETHSQLTNVPQMDSDLAPAPHSQHSVSTRSCRWQRALRSGAVRQVG